MRSSHLAVAALLGLPLVAQVDRLELSLRLREAERRLAATDDPARRKAGLEHFEKAVTGFFAFDLAATAESLSHAGAALSGSQLPPNELFAHALALFPKERLVDRSAPSITAELRVAIPRLGDRPDNLRLSIWIGEGPAPASTALADLPAELEIPLPKLAEGDHVLHWRLFAGDRQLLTREQPISVAERVSERLAALATATQGAAEKGIDPATLGLLAGMLQSMCSKRREETPFPGVPIRAEAEALAAAVQRREPCKNLEQPGEHWLAVPLPTRPQVLRIAIPERKSADERLPVVLALHGVGGSENMFFDAYGDGALVRACVARGWLVIAPRCPLMGRIDLPALVDALAARWPIDRQRVVLVGHSMGAMQSVAAVVENGANYRAVAALGGGGRVPKNAQLELPSFVGIGSRDFARANAMKLHDDLRRAGCKGNLREYPDVEHLTIVQIAAPDVVEFFAAALATPPR